VLPSFGGTGPAPTVEQLQAMGAAMYLFPALTTAAALQATWDLLHDFRERGTAALVEAQQRARSSRWGPADRAAFVGDAMIRELEDRYLPSDLQRDYQGTFGYVDRPTS
jgi:2-methylisocitrate lyase-like PEP mutase family enzyme